MNEIILLLAVMHQKNINFALRKIRAQACQMSTLNQPSKGE